MGNAVIQIKPLSGALLPDFLRFFDHSAFSDNPKWSSCHCQCVYEDRAIAKWSVRTAQENRAFACDGFREQGLEIAEANPRQAAMSDAENHFGPLSLYLAAGFTVHREVDDGSVYVRLAL